MYSPNQSLIHDSVMTVLLITRLGINMVWNFEMKQGLPTTIVYILAALITSPKFLDHSATEQRSLLAKVAWEKLERVAAVHMQFIWVQVKWRAKRISDANARLNDSNIYCGTAWCLVVYTYVQINS